MNNRDGNESDGEDDGDVEMLKVVITSPLDPALGNIFTKQMDW